MGVKHITRPHLWGNSDVAMSRYFALYFTQLCWLAFGIYLLQHAYWPSSCKPESFVEVYTCSIRLADNRGWIESTLMTWLWSTPLLVGLEVSRRWQHYQNVKASRR